MKDHNISARTPDDIWLTGMVDEYPLEAKVCDEASGFGIDCGRVIKLHIGKKNSTDDIAAYERGWDKYPCRANTGLARAVVRFCESLCPGRRFGGTRSPTRAVFWLQMTTYWNTKTIEEESTWIRNPAYTSPMAPT